MIKKINNNLDRIIYFLIIIVMIGLPLLKLPAYMVFLKKSTINAIATNPVYLLWWILPVLLIVYVYGLIIKKFKINFFDVLIYILIISGIVSTIKAINVNTSIYGAVYRNEGLLTLISYYLLFLNVKNISNQKYKRKLIDIFFILAIIQTFYSILQVYTNFSFIKHFSKSYMAMGFCGNPNFYGSYIIMPLMMSMCLYFIENKDKYFFLSSVYFMGLCLASSTGPFLGFIISVLFLLIVFRKKIKFKNVILILIIFSIIYMSVNVLVKYLHENKYNNKISSNYNISDEIVETIKTKKISGNGRIELWENTLPLIKNYGLFGAGLDNFANVYPQPQGKIYDKAHNIYLQMFITNGIFCIIPYFTLCLVIFVIGTRLKKSFLIALYMAFIAYSIQAFANISVFDVAPFFFIVLGLLASYINFYDDQE